MPAVSGGTETADTPAGTSASWRALGTLVQLAVTEPGGLAQASDLLARDLAAVDAACSRFRADSEIRALTVHGGPSTLDWRRLRRAEARVMREALAHTGRTPVSDLAA